MQRPRSPRGQPLPGDAAAAEAHAAGGAANRPTLASAAAARRLTLQTRPECGAAGRSRALRPPPLAARPATGGRAADALHAALYHRRGGRRSAPPAGSPPPAPAPSLMTLGSYRFLSSPPSAVNHGHLTPFSCPAERTSPVLPFHPSGPIDSPGRLYARVPPRHPTPQPLHPLSAVHARHITPRHALTPYHVLWDPSRAPRGALAPAAPGRGPPPPPAAVARQPDPQHTQAAGARTHGWRMSPARASPEFVCLATSPPLGSPHFLAPSQAATLA